MGKTIKRYLQSCPDLFKSPRMLTVTVDRKFFESPEAAYEHVTDNKLLSRLLEGLGIRIWVWVLEPQEMTGDGWPHWHILIDQHPLPTQWWNDVAKKSSKKKPADTRNWIRLKQFIGVKKADGLLQKWHVGACHLSRRKPYKSREHAINSFTRYITQKARRGFPRWMLEWGRNLRMFSCSMEVSKALRSGKPPDGRRQKACHASPSRTTRRFRSHAERISECDSKIVLIGPAGRSPPVFCLKESVFSVSGADIKPLDLYGKGYRVPCLDAEGVERLNDHLFEIGPSPDNPDRPCYINQRIARQAADELRAKILKQWDDQDRPDRPIPPAQDNDQR